MGHTLNQSERCPESSPLCLGAPSQAPESMWPLSSSRPSTFTEALYRRVLWRFFPKVQGLRLLLFTKTLTRSRFGAFLTSEASLIKSTVNWFYYTPVSPNSSSLPFIFLLLYFFFWSSIFMFHQFNKFIILVSV